MTASVGQNLPGIALSRSATQQPDGKAGEDGPAFDDLLGQQPTSGKQRSERAEPRGGHWERIRAGFAFGDGERLGKVVQAEKDASEVDDQSGEETPADGEEIQADKKATEIVNPVAAPSAQLPQIVSFQDSGRPRSDAGDIQAEPDAAAEQPDPLSAGKKVRTAANRDRKGDDTDANEAQKAPKIQVDRTLARNANAVQPATPANASNLPAEAAVGTAAAIIQPADENADGGPGQLTKADPTTAATEGRNISTDAPKQPATPRASVVAEQNIPAPANQAMTETARSVIDAIAGSESPARAAAATPTNLHNSAPVAVSAQILKIELHPAELGAVTANLRLTGEQLSIELKPETYEAHRRLTADSEAIVKSLKALGFDVDKVTILQPSIATTSAPRTDAPQPGTTAGRDQSSFQSGGSSGNGDGLSGQQSGRNRGDERHQDQRPAQPSRERSGRGLFI